jgi:hypothetical protein
MNSRPDCSYTFIRINSDPGPLNLYFPKFFVFCIVFQEHSPGVGERVLYVDSSFFHEYQEISYIDITWNYIYIPSYLRTITGLVSLSDGI